VAKRLIVLLALVSAISLIAATNGWAQATATIRGIVLDPQLAAVPNATVAARNVDTGIERSTVTTAEGYYTIPNLAPGTYDVRAEAAGFAKAEAKGVKLQVGDLKDVNFKLAIAAAAARVVVTGETPLVETTKTDTSTVINDKEMAGLPILTGFQGTTTFNDYNTLAATAPGVRYDFSGNNFDLIGPGAYNDRGNLINIDGGNIIDQVVSTRDALGASLSEVKEFQVISNNYNAEYGQAGNLIINVVTKSGTNDIHAEAHSDFRGRNLAASNWFYNATSPDAAFRRAPFQKYIWGVNAGGPFIKDRTFWFANFEKVHQKVPETLTKQAPDFTRSVTISQPTDEILWTLKFDHEITKANHLTVRFNEDRFVVDNLLVQISSFASPDSLTLEGIHDHTLNVGVVSNITPHLVNEGRFFWHRFLNVLPTKTSLPGEKGPNFYFGAAFCCPQGGLQHRYEGIDNVTYVKGTHTFKTGFNISHFPYFSLFQQFHFGRYEGFGKAAACAAGVTPPAGSGAGCTAASLGTAPNLPTQFTIGTGPGTVDARDNIYGVYAQDSWKIRPNVTINYGLRYDVEDGAFKGGTVTKTGLGACPAGISAQLCANIYGSTRTGGCFQGNGIISACGKDHNNVQPRLGIAWSPRFDSGFLHWVFGGPDRSVIRASVAEVTELAYLNIVLDSLNFDGKTLSTATVKAPAVLAFFPNMPDPGVLAAALPPASGFSGRVRPISDHIRNAETRHYSLSITRQIGNDFSFQIGYVGVQGFGQYGETDQNFPVIAADPAHPGFFFLQIQPRVNPAVAPTARPDNRFAAIRQNQNSRSSAYHGLLLDVTKRFSKHFQFRANYAYSKVLSSVEDFYGTSEPGDPFNVRAERAPSQQGDLRHLVNFTFFYDSATFTQRPILKHILNNITIGWAGTLQSGRPYPISTGEIPFTGTFYPGIGSESQQRPNVLPDGTLIATNIPSNSGLNLLISENGAAACACPQTTFLAPNPGAIGGADPNGPVDSATGDPVDFQFLNGSEGKFAVPGVSTLGRNLGKTDKFYRADISISKSFSPIRKRESFKIQLRADIINIFNHPNLLLFNGADTLDLFPIGFIFDAAGNVIGADPNCTSCIRAIGPLAGRYIGSSGQVLKFQDLRHGRVSKDINNPVFAGLGDPTLADIPRTIQLTFKIIW